MAVLLLAAQGAAAEVSVHALVEKGDVYVGEPFLFQIKVKGADSPEKPGIPEMGDFEVENLGVRRDNSSTVVIINGQVTQNDQGGYVFSYRLTPKRPGRLVIPAASVRADGQVFYTDMLFVNVLKAGASEDFKLLLELSDRKVYVGQPVTLTVTWYLNKDVQGFEFHLPVLKDARFDTAEIEGSIDPADQDRYIKFEVDGGYAIARRGRGYYGGREYTAVQFKKELIPKLSGMIQLPPATVACNALAGYEQKRGNSLFDPFGDFFSGDLPFGFGRRAVYKKYSVPSNQPVLTVEDLPLDGRPRGFGGLVGDYKILASAVPTDVSVGDPITLTIQVSGPEYLQNVELPRLDQQPALSEDFKVPPDMSPGKINRGVKTFTQTIRAKSGEVNEIPPVELPYFDVKRRQYAVARTEPIPIKVKEARVVTALDAEGREIPEVSKSELENWTSGIAHNYEDESVLETRLAGADISLGSPFLRLLLFGLPGLYLALWTWAAARRRRSADPEYFRARGAGREFAAALSALRGKEGAEFYGGLLAALRRWLGAKLKLAPGGLVFNDVKSRLEARAVPAEALSRLRALFEACEAGQYAGGFGGAADPERLLREGLEVVRNLDRRLR